MTILHMESNGIRALATEIKQTIENLRWKIQALNSLAQSVDWIGPSRDEFMMEMEAVLRQVESQFDAGVTLSTRLESEVDGWETTAAALKGSGLFIEFDLDKLRAGPGGILPQPVPLPGFEVPAPLPFRPGDFETLPYPISEDQKPGKVIPL